MMKKYLVAALLMLSALFSPLSFLQAKPVSSTTALSVAQNVLHRVDLKDVTPTTVSQYYIFVGADDHGFAIGLDKRDIATEIPMVFREILHVANKATLVALMEKSHAKPLLFALIDDIAHARIRRHLQLAEGEEFDDAFGGLAGEFAKLEHGDGSHRHVAVIGHR